MMKLGAAAVAMPNVLHNSAERKRPCEITVLSIAPGNTVTHRPAAVSIAEPAPQRRASHPADEDARRAQRLK